MTDSEEPRRGRTWLMPVVKIVLLLLAAFFVYRQVSWNDEVILTDGTVRSGEIVEGAEPSATEVVLETEDGQRLRLAEDAWKKGSKKFGVRTTFTRLSPGAYLFGMALIFAMYCLGVARWRLLLESQGLPTTYGRAFRLTFMGFFWNNFMPGMTGGDVAKAVLIARDSPGMRSEAVSTVIVDRVIGLAVLAFLSALAILSNFENFREQAYIVFGVLAACGSAFVCFFSRRVRRALKISDLLRKLPGSSILMKLDAAFQLYRHSPRALAWAFGLSAVAHVLNIGSVYVFGQDLGIPADLVTYFATVPIIFIISAVPISPGGWGVREVAFITAFQATGVPQEYTSQLVLLSVLFGFSTMIYSLLGGVFLFFGSEQKTAPADIQEAI